MNIIYDIEQGSDDWLMLRLGKLTASKFADVISKGRGKEPSKTRVSYMYQLAAEILVGEPTTFFKNTAMQWGTDCEPAARAAYELKHDLEVVECAFIEHNEFVGVSPDGLVGIDGLLEIKCPNTGDPPQILHGRSNASRVLSAGARPVMGKWPRLVRLCEL